MEELIGSTYLSPIRLSMANVPLMMCDFLQSAFERVEGISLVGPLNDLGYLLNQSDNDSVDIVIVGSQKNIGSHSSVEIIRGISERHKKAKSVVLTQNPDHNEIVSLFRAGSRGVLCTTDLNFELLCKCVRCVHEGQVWAANEYILHIISFLSKPPSANVTDALGRSLLTTREQQVLHLLADGLSNSELAMTLKLSEHTIKNHLFRIYDKLGVSSRMEAVLCALTPRAGLGSMQRVMTTTRIVPTEKLRLVKSG